MGTVDVEMSVCVGGGWCVEWGHWCGDMDVGTLVWGR